MGKLVQRTVSRRCRLSRRSQLCSDHGRIGPALEMQRRKSRTKASLSHLPLSDFEGARTQKLPFHIFHFHFLRKLWHESFVFTSPLSLFEGTLARNLRFHIFHFQILREKSQQRKRTETVQGRQKPQEAQSTKQQTDTTTKRKTPQGGQKPQGAKRETPTAVTSNNGHCQPQPPRRRETQQRGKTPQTKKQKDTSTWAEAPERQKTITNTTTQGKKTNTPGREEAPHTPKN